jgi:uncharacterized protein (DUF305 family)
LPRLRKFRLSTLVLTAILASASGIASRAQSVVVDEAPFLAENGAAMDKMMADMAVKPTGDVDADFAAMMIPHHQGAIDMALAELRHGKNEQLRRIAQEIIVEQQQEIIAMRLALGQPLPPSAPAQTQASPNSPAAPAAHDHSSTSRGAMSMSQR